MISQVHFFDVGYTIHPEASVMKKGRIKKIPFPAKVCALEHSKLGVVLFDTGYSSKFKEFTKKFPEKLYSLITPVFIDEQKTTLMQLKSLGISEGDVKYIIVSHFHADHIGGLRDFPHANYIYSSESKKILGIQGRFKRILRGFIPQFLPDNFLEQSIILENSFLKLHPNDLGVFKFGWDIFGDGSIWGIPLPGHAAGHMGIYFQFKGKEYFLIGDAAWTSKGLKDCISPPMISTLIFDSNKKYQNTFKNLHELWKKSEKEKRNLDIIPCHCSDYVFTSPH